MAQEFELLPHTSTVEEAERHYRVSAMQGHLRKLRIETEGQGRKPSIKEVEKQFDDLRRDNPDAYITMLYSRSMLEKCFSDLSDAQMRTGLEASDMVMRNLHHEEHVNVLARNIRINDKKPTEEELAAVRTKIHELLPEMELALEGLCDRSIEPRPREEISEGVTRGGVAAREPIKLEMAKAILRLRMMIYERHPSDLVNEVHNIQVEYESMD